MTITYYDNVYTCTTGDITSLDDAVNVGDIGTNRLEGFMMAVGLAIVIALMGMRVSIMDK